ncbi:MAG: response regulator [Hyphomicrobiales bacterium]
MSIRILLVDDDDIDADFLQRALVKSNSEIEITRASDGQRALQLLNDQTPDLIILDLVMPGIHGFDVLLEIRSNSTYATIPVLVCSGSDARDDVINSQKMGANAYIVKPQSPAEYRSLAESLNSFWFTWAQSGRPDRPR